MPAFATAHFSDEYDIGGTTEYTNSFDALFQFLPKLSLYVNNTDSLFQVTVRSEQSSTNTFPFTFPFQFSQGVFPFTFPFHFTNNAFPYTFPFRFLYQAVTDSSDKLLKFLPRFTVHNDNFVFQLYALWREPKDQFFKVNVTYPDPYTSKGVTRDILINILKLLKDSWSLTEDGAPVGVFSLTDFSAEFSKSQLTLTPYPSLSSTNLAFSTGWYNESIAMPQITITPLASTKGVLSCGSDPLYGYTNYVNIDIWVRPLQDSGRSIGQAKWAEYNIRREVERILRSGSRIGSQYNNEEFIYFGKRSHRDEIDKRPVIFRTTIQVIDNLFRETYGDE